MVVAVEGLASERRVIVVPITHSPPRPPDEGIAIPHATKARLGLDGEQFWIIVSEANDFAWPGPGLRFPPGQGPEDAAYGFLPPAVFRIVRDRFVARYKRRAASLVRRSE